jgi:hypothetical protein
VAQGEGYEFKPQYHKKKERKKKKMGNRKVRFQEAMLGLVEWLKW